MSTDTQSHLLRLLVPVLKLYTAKKVCTCFLMCAPDTEACTNLYGTYIGCTILAHQASTSLYFQLHLWRNKSHAPLTVVETLAVYYIVLICSVWNSFCLGAVIAH